ncbi:flagellar hook-basal body complex protein FliE [Rubrivivax sp. JA1026]|uniref:flagellar hook-basal body complex protein FliE n=1 Tax=Rubrivivax sp. JA1026 TaxID=2710888 RepID=UPI0013E97058|nr:flagellar hook-basal body complex protein FliE [Rubrivivax sp. JA1026]
MSQMLMSVLAQADRIAGDGAELGAVAAVAPARGPGTDAGAGFASSLKDVLQAVDAQAHAASEQLAAVDSGRSNDLVGAMLASQQADLSFSMLLQVRNKVAGAVDELIKLQL